MFRFEREKNAGFSRLLRMPPYKLARSSGVSQKLPNSLRSNNGNFLLLTSRSCMVSACFGMLVHLAFFSLWKYLAFFVGGVGGLLVVPASAGTFIIKNPALG
ncbi:hypothetical protein CL629_04805 [bacterium]|nr:hypothetical protein [bacterium]